jgi:hypothetical protein
MSNLAKRRSKQDIRKVQGIQCRMFLVLGFRGHLGNLLHVLSRRPTGFEQGLGREVCRFGV